MQLAMAWRIWNVDARAHNCDSLSTNFERGSVRFSIDAQCHSADDRYSRACQLRYDGSGRSQSVTGCVTRADDGHHRSVKQRYITDGEDLFRRRLEIVELDRIAIIFRPY